MWTSHTFVKKTCHQTRVKSTRGDQESDEPELRNVVGPRVYKARVDNLGLSQDELAGRLAAQGINLDRSAISRIESQQRYVMDYEVEALAKALKVTIAWLFSA